jgi:hypothetical protein
MVQEWNSDGGYFYCTLPNWPWGLPSLIYSGYWVIPKDKVAGALRSPPRVALRLKNRSIPLLPLWAFMAFSRVKFTRITVV